MKQPSRTLAKPVAGQTAGKSRANSSKVTRNTLAGLVNEMTPSVTRSEPTAE